jgi:drug/metabolite transporter (DMT)-like permease
MAAGGRAGAPDTELDRPLGGILFIIGAGIVFTVMNALAKELSQTLPVLMIGWGRYSFHLVFVLFYVGITLGPAGWARVLVSRRPMLQAFRSVLMLGATLSFFLAVKYVPLAGATAVNFIEPLVITILSFLLLKEQVGPRRWAAVIVGFVGVLIVVRPGFGMAHPAILAPIFGATCGALYSTFTRAVSTFDRPITSLAYSGIFGCLALSLAMPFVWQQPSGRDWLMLIGIGLSGGMAHLLVIRAFSAAPASLVAPFVYVQLLWTIAMDFWWFGNWPQSTTWAGASLIIATGIYIAHRERLRAQAAALARNPGPTHSSII